MFTKFISLFLPMFFAYALFSMNPQEKQRPNEYLNFAKVKAKDSAYGTVKVKCYNRGSFWVCPNPYDWKRSEVIYEEYRKGMYLSVLTYKISENDYFDNANWDS